MSKIHFIGAGQMAEAIIRASLKQQVVKHEHVTVSDIDIKRIQLLGDRYDINIGITPENALRKADYIVLGVRPQDDLESVAALVNQFASDKATIISIIAGVTLERLSALFGHQRPIVRMIPNTLTDTGLGYSGVVFNSLVDSQPLMPFLESFGKVMMLEERLIDTFTGFAVAGINYVYYFIEALSDAGVLAGMSRQQSTQVVWENLVGAVAMLQESGLHPRQLMDINNSPAGVGINGIYELNKSNFTAGLQSSVLAAVKRTTELSNLS